MRPRVDPAVIGLATLLVLCASDVVFGVRVVGVNIRFGQIALFVVVAVLVVVAHTRRRSTPPDPRVGPAADAPPSHVLAAWLAFFAAYALAALLAPDTPRTLLKLGWAMFNITLAARLSFSAIPTRALTSAFALAAATLATVIWIDALAIYWFDRGALIGVAQASYEFDGRSMLRPHGFHYEPSFAGALLALGLPLILASDARPRLLVAVTALTASGIVLTSARTGLIGLVLGMVLLLVLARRRQAQELVRRTLLAGALAVGLLGAFAVHPGGAAYLRFIGGPLGVTAFARLIASDPAGAGSEQARLESALRSIREIADRPLSGRGVQPGYQRVIGNGESNTWLEVGVESGLPGLIAFAVAIFLTLRWASSAGATPVPAIVAWAVHLGVNLNFTQTFPRLDYWLWFFFAVRLARAARTPSADPI